MAIETHTINVTAGTTLGEVLDAADDSPVEIVRDGVVYLVHRTTVDTSDEWDEELAERRRQDLWETAGAWRDIDAKELIADLYRRREEGSRSWDPPS